MPPVVIDLRTAEDCRDVVHQAVQALAEGRLVAFPTETVYGVAASALSARAVERLLEVKGRGEGHPLTLAIRSAEEARDYAPDLSPLGQRLARRCWPGPITLVVDASHPEGLVRQLPDSVRQAVSPGGTVGLRVPGHYIVLDVMRMLAGPLAFSSANRSGEPDAITADEVLSALGEELDLVVDDGPSRFGQPSSVLRIIENRYDVLRLGVVPEKTVRRLCSLMILLVCTGNTCRSPMAEAIGRDLIAGRLGCEPEQLEEQGVMVVSAGIAAMMGGRASEGAVQVMDEVGLDLRDHESQPLTEPLVRHADLIYTMTRSHREAIVAQWPSAAERTFVLSADGSDVSDPVGGPPEQYRHCAEQIREEMETRVQQLPLDAIPGFQSPNP